MKEKIEKLKAFKNEVKTEIQNDPKLKKAFKIARNLWIATGCITIIGLACENSNLKKESKDSYKEGFVNGKLWTKVSTNAALKNYLIGKGEDPENVEKVLKDLYLVYPKI